MFLDLAEDACSAFRGFQVTDNFLWCLNITDNPEIYDTKCRDPRSRSLIPQYVEFEIVQCLLGISEYHWTEKLENQFHKQHGIHCLQEIDENKQF